MAHLVLVVCVQVAAAAKGLCPHVRDGGVGAGAVEQVRDVAGYVGLVDDLGHELGHLADDLRVGRRQLCARYRIEAAILEQQAQQRPEAVQEDADGAEVDEEEGKNFAPHDGGRRG